MEIKLSEAAKQQIANTYADIIQKQILDGIDADGQPFPPGITLNRSGNLLRSIEGRVTDGEIEVVSDLDYAEIQQGRFNFAGVAPQYQTELEQRLQPIIEEGAELLDEE